MKKYVEGGLKALLENNYYKLTGQLEPYIDELKKIFEEEPPHTVNNAMGIIEKNTGIRILRQAQHK